MMTTPAGAGGHVVKKSKFEEQIAFARQAIRETVQEGAERALHGSGHRPIARQAIRRRHGAVVLAMVT
jgi:hypothetical protein